MLRDFSLRYCAGVIVSPDACRA